MKYTDNISEIGVFIPENLDIDEMLQKYPPVSPFAGYKLVYLTSLIFDPLKVELDENGFVHLHSQRLKDMGINEYAKMMIYLEENGVIEKNQSYQAGSYSMSYRMRTQYKTKAKKYLITKRTFARKIYKTHFKNEDSIKKYPKLYSAISELELDLDRAEKIMGRLFNQESTENPKTAIRKYNQRMIALERFKDGIWEFFADNTSGRLHTNLTRLKSELRSGLTSRGRRLESIDIVNSQPYLITMLLKGDFWRQLLKLLHKGSPKPYTICSNKPQNLRHKFGSHGITLDHTLLDLVTYILEFDLKGNKNSLNSKVTSVMSSILTLQAEPDFEDYMSDVASGRFYEKCLQRIGAKYSEVLDYDRKKIKEEVFFILFSDNYHEGRFKKLFQETYPSVYKIMHIVKSGKGQHNLLAILLQAVESYLVLKVCIPRIQQEHPDAFLATIHDSIVCHSEYVESIHQIIEDEAKILIGFAPKLRREKWYDDTI